MVDVRPWLTKEIWRIIRGNKSVSVRDIELVLIPESNTIADLSLRESNDRVVVAWGCMRPRDRQVAIMEVVEELYKLHRLVPRGTEKFSRYRPLVELGVLDSLSRIL